MDGASSNLTLKGDESLELAIQHVNEFSYIGFTETFEKIKKHTKRYWNNNVSWVIASIILILDDPCLKGYHNLEKTCCWN